MHHTAVVDGRGQQQGVLVISAWVEAGEGGDAGLRARITSSSGARGVRTLRYGATCDDVLDTVAWWLTSLGGCDDRSAS